MKNDNHVWDNKLPTAQMLGRWQPWHAGHQKLFEEILKKTGQVNIMVRVKGDSMIEAGINDGDTVIVKKTSNVDSGQIGVVLIDDQEATLKRIRKKGNTIALEAANRNYGTKIYSANRIKIQGKLVSLYRNFL